MAASRSSASLIPVARQVDPLMELVVRAGRSALVALALAAHPVVVSPLAAQAADTTHAVGPLFTGRDAAIFGGFALGTLAVAPLDRWAAERLQDPNTQANRFFSGSASVVRELAEPGSLIIGATLYGVGRLAGNERMADIGLHGTEAILIGIGVTSAIKVLAGRARPYAAGDTNTTDYGLGRGLRHADYRSFPSGHTVMAFAAAAAVTKETSRWWPNSAWYVGPAMYGGATLVGLSRMYNNKHWASDVVMGAAFGAFSGWKVVKYHHAHPGNRLDRWLLSGSITPNGRGGAAVRLLLLPM